MEMETTSGSNAELYKYYAMLSYSTTTKIPVDYS
jgi:hypothetical protein